MLGPTAGGLPQRQALRDRRMGVGLARQDDVAPVVESQRPQGLVLERSSPRQVTPWGATLAVCVARPRVPAAGSQFCVACPTCGMMDSGGQGDALHLSRAGRYATP